MPSARYGALFLVEPLVWLTTSFGWLHRGGRSPRPKPMVGAWYRNGIDQTESQPSVMQPWLASSTFLMYFQSAPLLALRGGAAHSF